MKQTSRFSALFFISILTNFLFADLSNIQPGQSIWCISKEIGSVLDVLSAKIPDSSLFDVEVSQLVEVVCSKIDLVRDASEVAQSLLCDTISTIDSIQLCMSTTVTGSTTLTDPGLYCVSQNFAGTVVIEADEVTLDINNHVITGDVEILSDQADIIIQNGVIDNDNLLGNAILVNTGARNIALYDVTTKNAQIGTNFQGVVGGLISNCSFVQNITGIELNQSHKIVIDHCVAECNSLVGFSLVSSTTNIIQNSQALSTGENNLQTTGQEIFGFVSQDGYGNIFEQCIANSTQGEVADASSLVAGFALRGSEGCTKIIENESANTQISSSSLATVYGIVLENTAHKNVVMQNTVYCTSGGTQAIGISGDNVSNLIIQNVVYNNPINLLLGSNIDQIISSIDNPTLLQNTAIVGCDTIPQPEDQALLVKQIKSLIIQADSTLDLIESKLPRLSSVNDVLSACVAVQVMGETTITDPGIYCVAQTFTGSIVINADDVELRLNNYTIVGAVQVGAQNNVVINNGTIDNNGALGDAISVALGASNINVDNMMVANALIGMHFEGVAGGLITNCSMTQNVTGLQLDSSHKLVIDSCTADCSINCGFDLINSTTNIVQDCRAISTGQNNTNNANQTIFGFVSSNGSSNVFERCIANGTQGLDVVDVDSVVAGFALRGSESCTKIIESESGNTQTNASGSTVPYGILLEDITRKNIIIQNIVYCTAGAGGGIGIFGNNVDNLIIQNTIYNNPIGMQVGSHLDEIISSIDNPTPLQNVVVGGCEQIPAPDNVLLLAEQLRFQACQSQSVVDIIEEEVDFVVDALFPPCRPNQITTATTIAMSGIYCLGNPIAGSIVISASDVQLDLNTYTITGDISVQAGAQNITIHNGVIDNDNQNGNALLINSSVHNVNINNILVRNAQVGVKFDGVIGGTVSNCSMVQNVTGMQLNAASKITIDSCLAECNLNAGFDLISSTTNIIQNSKALATGQANNHAGNQTIFGFVSADGYGNVFENCIANDTQGLQVIDGDSLVAGFALRGSEECAKIIACESGNTQTNPDGVAVPYGIIAQDITLKNTIMQNVVYSTAGASSGVGISGNNVNNLIIQNTVYNNPIGMLLGSQIDEVISFIDGPTELQNIVVPGCYAIPIPGDPALLASQIIVKSSDNLFLLDEIEMKLNSFSTTTTVGPCEPILIEAASLPTTINDSGIYCLANNALHVGDITINANDVELRMANRTLQGSLVVNGANARIVRGVIDAAGASAGIYVSNTADGLLLSELCIENATVGVGLNGVSGGLIEHCSFVQNVTGVQLDMAHKIVIDDCIANCNLNAGFDLINSTTNLIQNSKALSTGENNFEAAAQTIVGFVSSNGNGNIFENCIANGTQGLQVLDSNSLVAGFALRGSEECTKIVACESGNTHSNFEGATIPYGIIAQDATLKNIIIRNVVYCTAGAGSGIGISGNNINNLIIQNTVYNNPVGMLVGSQIDEIVSFIDGPTELQNIVVPGCDAIPQPADVALLARQLKPGLIEGISAADVFNSTADLFLSAIDEIIGVCGAVMITVAPTTISEQGIYCLAQAVTGEIVVESGNVELDLNRSRVTGNVTIGGVSNVTVKNGLIDNDGVGGIALNVSPGAENITVSNVITKNAAIGVNFDGVTGGVITRCSLTQNSTGVRLEQSHKINIRDCTAIGNSVRGFSLISSTTNVITSCKALNTGFGNIQTFNNSVFGFACENGSGNILEDCVANATQALTTTDFVSQIAGIAFLGTEECGKIIGCEAGNAKVAPDGFSIPRGILLESRFVTEDPDYNPSDPDTAEFLITLTASPETPFITSPVFSVDWSPDSQFLVLNDATNKTIVVYKYDYIQNRAVLAATADISSGIPAPLDRCFVEWDPSGKFIAVSVTDLVSNLAVRIYSFSAITNTLEFITETSRSISGGAVNNVAWHPSGRFIAYGTVFPGARVYVDAFNPIANTLTPVTEQTPVGDATFSTWHPSGQFLAVGDSGVNPDTGGIGFVQVYGFNGSSLSQVSRAGFQNTVLPANPLAGAWSPDAAFFAVVEDLNERVAFFTFINEELNTVIEQTNPTSGVVGDGAGVEWSSDGNYVALAGSFAAEPAINVLFVDRSNNSIEFVARMNIVPSGDTVRGVSWSRDGGLIAGGVPTVASDLHLVIYEALKFPQKNVIKNNTVYCNSGGIGPSGVGLSGSSIANLILNNVSYANPVAENVLFDTNYAFVTNVFNSNFSNQPNDLQNLSIGGCQPLPQPVDLPSLIKGVNSSVDALRPTIIELESKIDMLISLPDLNACTPIGIAGSDVPTTISVPGIYCLAQTSTGNITITADDVELRMNNQRLLGSIMVSGANARIREGLIDADGASVGISASNTADGILLSQLRVNNAIVGIEFNGVSGGIIEYCTLSQNTTGVQLDGANKITIHDCVADCNLNAGFDLFDASGNVVQDCKALSTGENNLNSSEQTIFGFSASNGSANIFERCIANATQGLSTTDIQSLVAGFALRGSESCTKIIECESGNTQTSAVGGTLPNGIFIESTISDLSQISSVGSDVRVVSWSHNGKYIAYRNAIISLIVSEVNYQNNTVQVLATASAPTSIFDIAWSADDTLIALTGGSGSDNFTRIFEFDHTFKTLTQIHNFSQQGRYSVSWSPDNKYLIAGDNNEIWLYERNLLTNEMVVRQNLAITGEINAQWSPNGEYVALSLYNSTLRIYRFDKVTKTISLVNSLAISGKYISAAWSPDGNYIALGSSSGLRVYPIVDGVIINSPAIAPSVSFVAGVFYIRRITWSPDGRFIVAAGSALLFDRANNVLTPVVQGAFSQNIVAFSPDGSYLATSNTSTAPFSLKYGLNYPSKNIITNNLAYCNSGGVSPFGIGINGSSIKNMIINNISYNNPINPYSIETNYAGVLNIFDPLFSNEPTTLQNISVPGCDAIAMPEDLALLTQQFTAEVCSVVDGELMQSAFDLLVDATPTFTPVCFSMAITQVPTTINVAGTYCLAQISTGDITINVSDVSLNLNHQLLNGAVLANGQDQLTIRNGIINATGINGVSVSNGSHITAQDLVVKNAQVGIAYENISGGLIKNCTLTQNVTGVLLDDSHKICIQDCVASCNTNAGFDLISSTTNVIQDCKALSTGEGNNELLNQTIVGFVSSGGYGNIFERCIANATQALSTTDYNSVVAGFALRDSERCTKIIECESANGQTSASGVTVPYGILLEGTLDNLFEFTFQAGPTELDNPVSSNWSPDGQYVAVCDNGDYVDRIIIYTFDRNEQSLIELVRSQGDTVLTAAESAEWSPDGNYIAVGNTGSLVVYQFDRMNNSLTEVAVVTGLEQLESSEWSPDGNYISVANNGVATGSIIIYKFDRVNYELTEFATGSGSTPITNPLSSAWSPDGNYIAVAENGEDEVIIYTFNEGAQTLTELTTAQGTTTIDAPNAAEWSPDGKFVAVSIANTPKLLVVYEFDEIAQTLEQVAVSSGPTVLDTPQCANWSGNGRYVATANFIAGNVVVYEFDRGAHTLTEIASYVISGFSFPLSAEWSPDGAYISVADGLPNTIFILDAIQFPSKNVIKDNIVYCNSGASIPSGVGISGSSIQNMIIGNTAYGNPPHPFMVPANYAFVTNVYNPLFELSPTVIQNIALGGCEPIASQDNIALLVNQIDYRVNEVLGCQSTAITAANISGGTISLTTAGSYCLATDLAANMLIMADDISVDLNERTLTGLVTVQSADNVMIQNGRVTAPAPTSLTEANRAAAGIASTATNATLSNVIIRCADTNADGVNGRSGVVIQGNDVQINDCSITSGAGANSVSGPAGSGGFGIVVNATANKTILKNNTVVTGRGGVSSAASGMGGDGGVGICVVDSAQDTSIIGCTVLQTGDGGSAVDTMAGTGGLGGDGIAIADANKTLVTQCIVRNAGLAGQPLPLKDLSGGIELIFHGRALTDLLAPGTGTPGSMAYGTISYNINNLQPIIFQSLVDDLNQESAWALAPQGNMIEPILDGMGMQIGQQLVGVGDFSNVVLQQEAQPSPQDQITAAQNAGQLISSGAKVDEGAFVARASVIVPNN